MTAQPLDQPLSGVRVVELADGIAGPYTGKLLADFGAEVVKVEPPGGDRTRTIGPFPDEQPDLEQSALFLHLNTNKRSVVADPSDPLVADLLARADVVLQSAPVPDPAELRATHPNLIVASVTSFGLTGPTLATRARRSCTTPTVDRCRPPVRRSGSRSRWAAPSGSTSAAAWLRWPCWPGWPWSSGVAMASTSTWPTSRPRSAPSTGA